LPRRLGGARSPGAGDGDAGPRPGDAPYGLWSTKTTGPFGIKIFQNGGGCQPPPGRCTLVSVPWSPTAAKTPTVSSTATAATAASRPGAASSAGRSGPGAAGQLIRDMRPLARTARDPRSAIPG